jgi:hypothetical protein
MGDPIEVNYIPDGDDWTVTAKGRGQTLTGRAPGLIAARDRADQLVEKLAPNEEHRTVVHLLKGDAVEFTTAYLTARLAKPEPVAVVPVEVPEAQETVEAAAEPAKPSPRPRPTPPPVPTPQAAEPEKAEEPASP